MLLSSFYAGLNAMAPIALELLLGYLLARFKLLKKADFATLNKFAFSFLLPFLFFNSMRNADFGANINLFELIVYIVLTALTIVFGWFYGAKCVKSPNMKAPAMQAFFRTNCTIFALPIAKTLFPESELTTMILYMALVIPFLNLLSVILLASYGDDNGVKTKVTGKDLLRTIITSPVILGTIIGIIWNPIQHNLFTFPTCINRVFTSLGSMSTVLLLIAVGGSLNLDNIKTYGKEVVKFTPLAMVVKPLVCCLIMMALGFRGTPLVLGVLILGTPAPVATVGMAVAQKRDGVFAGLLVSVCSLISVLTLFLFIFGLGSLGLVSYNF